MKILIPGGGGKAQHIRAFQDVAGVESVIITEINAWAYGNFVADRAYRTPAFADLAFMTSMESILEHEPVDVCLPLHDASLMVFDQHRTSIENRNIFLAMNPTETLKLVADKIATARFFDDLGLPSPRLWLLSEFLQQSQRAYPYYVKPRFIDARGTADQFFSCVDDETDLNYISRKLAGREDEFVIQEFAQGVEVNIDFFCGNDGELKSVVALTRLGMGISRGITRGEIISDPRFDEAVQQIVSRVRFWGANQLQAFISPEGEIVFSEINGRVSGSSVFVREAGVDYFAAVIKLINGEEVAFPEPQYGLKMNCWESPFFYRQSPLKNLQ